ncbi:MAG: 30S ribosomal protein S20 [Phycisphaerae bacterium]|nr:30S ribosomal protein S20 [Phycisphaerae bacterium]
MAHSLSAKKRIRQNARRRARNQTRKTALKSNLRRFGEVVAGADARKIADALPSLYKVIDRAASQGTLHPNTAARRKSRAARMANAVKGK